MIQSQSNQEYDHKAIEYKWQKRWSETGLYQTDLDNAFRPFYNLMMFPYPSAKGLHVGNIFAFTGADIYGRYKAMSGFDVFEPIGFDAFGIHSENYALQMNEHPKKIIQRNIAKFREQFQSLGARFDWSRVIDTTEPDYYRWNQWLFIKLFKAGLAVKKNAPVNWCPACKTVLADEQVVEEYCERCGTRIERKELEQWSFKITYYAERLLKDLETLNWSETVKAAQRNWISGLHDWTISRQRYWGTPIPIVYCNKCGVQPVPEAQLPVILPEIDNWRPTGTGKSPLAEIPSFINTICPVCGGAARRETDVMDNFVDSSWYYLRYPSGEFQDRPFDAERTQKWLPVDMYIGGKEHAVLHLLYSRFICLALYDLGYIQFKDPFKRFFAHGLITIDGAKMSKSRPNAVSPDRYFDRYGADTLRIYLMFTGPYEQGGDFSDTGINGIYRFLNRVWKLCQEPELRRAKISHPEEAEKIRHLTIRKVTEDFSKLKFNTAIASLMQYQNYLEKRIENSRQEIETLLLLLAPLAPHLAEELWESLGNSYSIHSQQLPAFDPELVRQELVDIPVQINGKTVSIIHMRAGARKEEVSLEAFKDKKVAGRLPGIAIKSVIYIPDRTINFITG